MDLILENVTFCKFIRSYYISHASFLVCDKITIVDFRRC